MRIYFSWLVVMFLWDNTLHWFSLTYSAITTSSAMADIFSMRTHPPILQCHDTILFAIRHPLPIYVPLKIEQFLSLLPAPILQFAPMTTLGPILHSGPILAVGSIRQFPSHPSALIS